jgi:hypothetical protein
MPRLGILLLLALAGCAPAQSELYPPNADSYWMRQYSVTHDPHRPWQFQQYNEFDGGR